MVMEISAERAIKNPVSAAARRASRIRGLFRRFPPGFFRGFEDEAGFFRGFFTTGII
jgi:hypothetical protein